MVPCSYAFRDTCMGEAFQSASLALHSRTLSKAVIVVIEFLNIHESLHYGAIE